MKWYLCCLDLTIFCTEFFVIYTNLSAKTVTVETEGVEPSSVRSLRTPSFTCLVNFTKLTNSRAPILPLLLATVEGSLKWVAPPTGPQVCNFVLLKQLPLTGLSCYELSTGRSANVLVNKAPERCSVATYVLIRILRVQHLPRHADEPK